MYEQLEQFAGGYFHQDFWSEYPSVDAAIADFRDNQGRGSSEELVAEIADVLASGLTGEELRHLWLRESHAYYDPTVDGYTYRGWFEHVRDLLRE